MTTKLQRVTTGFDKLDRVLGGGGLVVGCGSLVVFQGERGVGLTTLALQICDSVCKRGLTACFLSGDMPLQHVFDLARRLGIDSKCHAFGPDSSSIGGIGGGILVNPDVVVVDSLQTAYVNGILADVSTPNMMSAALKALSSEALARRKRTIIVLSHVVENWQERFSSDPNLPVEGEHVADVLADVNRDGRIRVTKNRYGETPRWTHMKLTSKGWR